MSFRSNLSSSRTPLTFTRQEWLIGLLIVALAFGVRLVIIADRAASPVISGFDPIPVGSDQAVYYGNIADHRAGNYPPPTYFFQPGMPWLLIVSSTLLRTDNPGALRVLLAWLAAVNCGLLVATARLAFRSRAVSYVAGLLLALYPVSAFYDTDFIITAQATQLISLMLFGTCWLWRAPRNWTGAVLIGLSVGLLALFRFELVALLPVICVWLIVVRRDRKLGLQLMVAAATAAAVIAPVALYNRANGANYLITPVGTAELYRGNNRDADGTYGGRLASEMTNTDYVRFLWEDIRLSPVRFIELELHKLGLYVSRNESGNDLSYVESGVAVSGSLRADPLNFPIIFALALFGLWAAWHHRQRRATVLFGLALLTMCATTMAIWVEARIRTPVIVVLSVLAAYGIVAAVGLIRKFVRAIRHSPRMGLRLARVPVTVSLSIALVLALGGWAESDLPRPVLASALPSSAQPIGAVFDQTLELVGWHIDDQYSPPGTIRPFSPYVVSIYWRLRQPASVDYSFALGFFLNGQRLNGVDQPIGTVSYPPTPTSQWQPGEIHVEHLALTWRNFDTSVMLQSGDLFLSVYRGRDALDLLAADTLPGHPDHLDIARPAIVQGSGVLPASWPISPTPISFGNALTLIAWQAPTTARPGESLSINLGWHSGSQPITRSYTFGVYTLTADEHIATQTDTLLHGGKLLASSLPPDYILPDTIHLAAPTQSGAYRLTLAVYDTETHDRLLIPGIPSALYDLSTLVVSP